MEHPRHNVIFPLFTDSFPFTEADQPPKINSPLFKLPSAFDQRPIHLCGRPDASIKWKQIVQPYLWGLVFLSRCCGNNWRKLRKDNTESRPGCWGFMAWCSWAVGRPQGCRAHTHIQMYACTSYVARARLPTITHMLHETTAVMPGTDPQSNTVSGKRSHKTTTTKCRKAGRGLWKAWLKAVSHCFCSSPTKQAQAKDKWEKQHQWLHLSQNPKGLPCVLE